MQNDFEKSAGIHDEARAKNFTYKTEYYFHGHCSGEGNEYYDHLVVEPHFYKNIRLIYGQEIQISFGIAVINTDLLQIN